MKCNFCREEIPDGEKICPLCGSPVNNERVPQEHEAPEREAQDQPDPDRDALRGGQKEYSYQYGLQGQSAENVRQDPINGTLYLILSVLATLLCCLPFGIIGIIFSSRINSQQKNGDYEGARISEKMAKIFLILSLLLGIVAGGCAAVGYSVIGIEKTDFSSDEMVYSESMPEAPEDGDGADGELDGLGGEIKLARQEQKLGKSWDSYTVQINDKVITLPCEYKDLAAAGLAIDESLGLDDDGMVAGSGYLIGYMADENGNSMTVEFINPDSEEKRAEECLIGGITVGDYDLKDKGFKITFPGGVQIGDSKDDVAAKYGEPEETYEGDTLHVFTWNDPEMYFSTVEADFDSESGKLIQMSMKNYGSENDLEN